MCTLAISDDPDGMRSTGSTQFAMTKLSSEKEIKYHLEIIICGLFQF